MDYVRISFPTYIKTSWPSTSLSSNSINPTSFKANKPEYGIFIEPYEASNTRKQDYPDLSLNDSRKNFLEEVNLAIEYIHFKRIKKIVLSRAIKVRFTKKIDLDLVFNKALSLYPDAFVFYIDSAKHGKWIGASPELVANKYNGDAIVRALGGTRSKKSIIDWTLKEKKEHEIIVQDIYTKLNRISHSGDIRISKPFTSRYNDIEHITTDLEFKTSLGINNLTKLVHPTPALVGEPIETAKEFIDKFEKHKRSLYTGYVIVSDSKGDGFSFSPIRCCKIIDIHSVIFYVGCGIIAESNAIDELTESEYKFNQIMSVFRQ